jgi:hypothetical protein
MGAIGSREIKGISQPPRRSVIGKILWQVAALQKLVQDSLIKIPGWPQFVEVTRTLSAPVRWLAETTQRRLPFTRRLDWLLEIERLKSLHPVILTIAIAWAIRRGLFTTQYGHIGTDTLIYPTIATISYFNPFLGVVTGIAFGIGDIVQKLFSDDIFGTTKGDANYHAALLGYCIAYSSLMFAGMLPGVVARIFQLVARTIISMLLSAVARARADGATSASDDLEALGNPLSGAYPLPELIASMAGAALGGYAVMHAAPILEYPAFYLRPHPDVSCHNLEMSKYLVGRSGTVATAAAVAGPALSTILNPAKLDARPPGGGGEGGEPIRSEPYAAGPAGSLMTSRSGGAPPSHRAPEPQAALAHARQVQIEQSIEIARKSLADMQAELNALTPARRDLVRNSPEFRDSWNLAQQALDSAQYAKMQIEAQLNAEALARSIDPGTPELVSAVGAGAMTSDAAARVRVSGARQSYEERSADDIQQQESAAPPVPAHAGQSLLGAPPTGPSSVVTQFVDRHYADIFNPDGTLNKTRFDNLIDEVKNGQIRELPQKIGTELQRSYRDVLDQLSAWHDAEHAAFQGNLTTRSLAQTIFGAAQSVIAQRKAASAARAILAREEVAAALRVAGLELSPTSPLAGLSNIGSAVDESLQAALQQKGVIDTAIQPFEAWRHALATLAAPSHWVHITAGDSDEVQTVRYYLGDAGIVAHIIDNERHEISFPVKIEDSLEEAGKWLGWRLFPQAAPFSVDLSCEELIALAAATDALREDQMRAALERRRPEPSYRFPTDRLAAEIESGRKSPPGRWFTEMLMAHLPARYAPRSESLPAGLESLTQRTWLSVENGNVSLAAPMPGICLELGSPTPFLLVGVGSGAEPGTYVMAVRGLSGFWTLRFGVPEEDKIRFARIGGRMLEGLVYYHLASVLGAARRGVEPGIVGPESSVCSDCHSPLRPGARFCSRCGTPRNFISQRS